MSSLTAILLTPPRRAALTEDVVALVEGYVRDRGGLKGMTYRTGLAMLKTAKPGILERAAHKLLPAVLEVLEPLHQRAQEQATPSFAAFVQQHAAEAAQGLLRLADTRVREASPLVQKTYARFRTDAETEARALLPGFAALIERHLAESANG